LASLYKGFALFFWSTMSFHKLSSSVVSNFFLSPAVPAPGVPHPSVPVHLSFFLSNLFNKSYFFVPPKFFFPFQAYKVPRRVLFFSLRLNNSLFEPLQLMVTIPPLRQPFFYEIQEKAHLPFRSFRRPACVLRP